jgi:hypothetical protein
MEEKFFLMPDYYNSFSCKMGECRRACCEGWPITFSVEDYFKLMGCECSYELRRRFDTGIKVSLSPTPDMYAAVVPRYDGSCPMRLEDGRCSIHAELGENALSDVCRLYPRGLRVEPEKECSCSNSCEAVLELLFSKEDPIKFISDICLNPLPPMGKRGFVYPTMGFEQKIRLHLIKIIQDRTLSLSERLFVLGNQMRTLEEIIEKQDKTALEKWFETTEKSTSYKNKANSETLDYGIKVMKEILKLIDKQSESVSSFGEEAISFFDSDEDGVSKYIWAKNQFETTFPEWEIYFEHMIVNHMFFEQFPFQDRPVSLWNEFISICAIYSLMRFLSLGNIQKNTNISTLVDMFSSIFRLVDHSLFDSYSAELLKRNNCATAEKLFQLIAL